MNKGFTIVELLAVIAILGILVIIVTPTYDTVNNNIRKMNYDSRKNEIKSQTISFIEKYAKDKVYDGTNSNILCFTPAFLIQNGIISSDDEKEEYIKNDYTNEQYSGDENVYIKVLYEINKDDMAKSKLKLYAITIDETTENGYIDKQAFNKNDCTLTDTI